LEPDISSLAALIGEPARGRILFALLDGRSLPATELNASVVSLLTQGKLVFIWLWRRLRSELALPHSRLLSTWPGLRALWLRGLESQSARSATSNAREA